MNIIRVLKSSPAYIFPALINLLSLLVFTRVLTLEDYGQLSLALISIEFIQGALYQWVKLAMMRFYNSNDKMLSLSTGLQFNFGTSILLLIVAVLLFVINAFIHSFDPNFLGLIILGSILRGLYNYIQDHIRISDIKLKKYTIFAVLANAFYYVPAILYVLVFKHFKVNEILLVQVAGLFIYLFVYGIKRLQKVKDGLFRIYERKIYIEFLKYGIPLIVVFLASSMFIRVDRYIIEYTVGLKALGIYSAAFSLSNLAISSFITILTLPTYPEIIRQLNAGNEKLAKEIYDRNGNTILIISVPSLLICCLFNHLLCHIFFGAKGDQIQYVFPYVVIGTFLYNFKQHYFDQVFQFCKKTRIYMILGSLVGLSHLVVSYIFCRIWGAAGVAGSNIILNLISIVFVYYYSKSFFKISFNKWLKLSTFLVALFLSFLFFLTGNIYIF